MIAVTFALPAESSEFLSCLKNRTRTDRDGISTIRGTIDRCTIEVLHTGVGEKVCRERLGKFLEQEKFNLLISSGFAGALNDEFEVGDLLLAKNFSTIELKHAQSVPTMSIHAVDILTVPALIDATEERERIARESGASAIDMETEFIARACAAQSIPLLSLRVITDTPTQAFPAPPSVLFDMQQQRTHIAALAKFFLINPSRLPRMIQFARRVARARSILTNALVEIIRRLEL